MPPTVVIIEDEQDTADMLSEMVRLSGYQVFKAPIGNRAIPAIADRAPAVILLDIMMPDVSGLELLRSLQRDPRLRRIPVVIVSAKSMPADVRRGLEAGAVSYLTKPVEIHTLKEAVDRAVGAYGS